MKIMKIAIFLIIMAIIINSVSAVKVEVVPSTKNIRPGQNFTVNISITPEKNDNIAGNYNVAGAQTNFLFNSKILNANNIKEGNLLKLSGGATIFNAGIINNTIGEISDIYGAIITPGKSVSKKGIFATIEMTANKEGISYLNLSNIIVGNSNGDSLNYRVINSSIKVMAKGNPRRGSGNYIYDTYKNIFNILQGI